jgi:hypothetical protein
MNEAVMLPYIVQCLSDVVSNAENRIDSEKTEKIHPSNPEVSKVGGTLVW